MSSDSAKQTVAAASAGLGDRGEKVTADMPDVQARTMVMPGFVAAANALPRGATIGRFVIVDVLGEGAVGVVYKAYDPTLGREVALKRLQSRSLGERAQARLLDEARAMAKVSHPNVVTIHEVAVCDEQVVLAMECVAGSTLWQWTRAQSRPWRAVVAAYREAGKGLAAAHRAGLVHRDFKPANVLVGDDGRIRVTDFGIAMSLADTSATGMSAVTDSESLVDHTRHDAVAGTPWYMAPEQHRGGEIDARSDQDAFCLSLWEALAGETPFPGENIAHLRAAKRNGPPSWPKTVPVPRRITEALARGLCVAPGERFATMDALLEALSYDPAVHRRRWLVGAMVVPAVSLSSAWAWQAERRTLCSGAEEQLEGVWDDARRQEVAQAFAATDLAYAPRASEHVMQTLDQYRKGWTAQFAETCAATVLRAEQSRATMDLRMACLHRGKLELRSTVNLLAQADAQVVERSMTMMEGLPQIEPCADLHDGADDGAIAETPEDAAKFDEVRGHLADAEALRRAGKYEAALIPVEAARTALGDLRNLPLLAEIGQVHGMLESGLGRYQSAETMLREALRMAIRAGTANSFSTVAANLASNLAVWQHRPNEAQWFVEVALDVALEQADALAEAKARMTLGDVLQEQRDFAASEAEYRRAIELWDELHGPGNLDAARTRNNLANTLRRQGRRVEAEEQYRIALAVYERMLGTEHPTIGDLRNNLGVVMLRQGFVGPLGQRAQEQARVGPRPPGACFRR